MVNCIALSHDGKISECEVPLNSKQSQNSAKKTFRTPTVKTILEVNGKTVSVVREFTDNAEFKNNARLWKFIVVFIVIYSIIGVLYYISTKSPSTETLIENEKHILNMEEDTK